MDKLYPLLARQQNKRSRALLLYIQARIDDRECVVCVNYEPECMACHCPCVTLPSGLKLDGYPPGGKCDCIHFEVDPTKVLVLMAEGDSNERPG